VVQLLPFSFQVINLRPVVHTCVSVTKQYKLIPVKGRWCPTAGKVTNTNHRCGIALAMHHRLQWFIDIRVQWLTEGRWAPRLNSSKEYGTTSPFYSSSTVLIHSKHQKKSSPEKTTIKMELDMVLHSTTVAILWLCFIQVEVYIPFSVLRCWFNDRKNIWPLRSFYNSGLWTFMGPRNHVLYMGVQIWEGTILRGEGGPKEPSIRWGPDRPIQRHNF